MIFLLKYQREVDNLLLMKKGIVSLWLIFALSGYCQTRDRLSSPAVGQGAYSLHHLDAFSFTCNEACLASQKNMAIGIFGERRFLLDALNYYTIALVIPTSKGNFGLEADYFGFKNYNESQLGIGYGKSLGSKVSVGIRFNYYMVKVPGYISATSMNYEAGAMFHLSEKLHAGIHVYNPVGGKLGKSGEKLASIYKFGMGFEPSDKFFISTEIIKVELKPVNVLAVIDYNFKKRLFVKLGISSENTIAFATAGISFKDLRIDVSGSYHPVLGISPGLSLSYEFKKGK